MIPSPKLFSITLFLILLASVALSACDPAATPSTSPPTTIPEPGADTSSGEAAAGSPGAGQRITIAGKSTVLLAGAVYMFPEAQEQVVAMVRPRQNVGDLFALLDPRSTEKMVLEVEAGPEQIAATQPDVVILKRAVMDQLGRPLEKIGIPVVAVDLETPEQYRQDLITLGNLLGNPARAEAIWAFYQSRLDRAAAALEGLEEAGRPRALLLQYSAQGSEVTLEMPAAGWIQTIEVELAGCTPVWKEAAQGGGWQVVNLEQIAAWDPDKLFIVDYQQDPSEVVAGLKADPQWSALRAVQAGEIYGFPGDYINWGQPDARWILGLTWLATRCHPDRLAEVDMEQEIRDFFQQVYGLEPDVIESAFLSRLQGDLD